MEGECNGKRCDLINPLILNGDDELEVGLNSSLKEGNASFFATVFNGLNTILGSGVLLVPYALASGGWLSLGLLFALSIAGTYTGILIKRCMEFDPSIKAYADTGEHAFGNIGKVLVSIILYNDLYMVETVFLILEGDNLHTLFPDVGIELFGFTIDGRSSFIIIVALILLPSVWLDNLSILAYVSASGVLASFVILGSVLWVGAFDGVGFNPKGGSVLNIKGIPTAISLYMLCFASHPVIPALYTSMKKKVHFSKVLLLCFILSTFVYVSMAVLGYLMFGPGVKSQVTLSLPTNKLGSKIAIYTTFITPLAKYALLLKPMVVSTESWFSLEYQKKKQFRIFLRTSLVVTQVIVALVLPFFGYLMSLVGALLSATITSLAIPCLCYLKISKAHNSGLGASERVFIWEIVVLSMFIVMFGTYTSL